MLGRGGVSGWGPVELEGAGGGERELRTDKDLPSGHKHDEELSGTNQDLLACPTHTHTYDLEPSSSLIYDF